MKRLLTILVILGLLAAAGYAAYRYYDQQRDQDMISSLQTVSAARGSLTASVGATGMVRPNQSADLLWRASGTVSEVLVEVGQPVQAGARLAVLDQASLPQNLILAQAELVEAQKALDDLLSSQVARTAAWQAVYEAESALIEAGRALDVFDEAAYKDELDRKKQDVVDREEDLQTAQGDFEPYKDWDPDNQTYKVYKQRLDDAQNAYDEAQRLVDELELDQQLAQAGYDSAQAVLADAQRQLERLEDGPNPDDVRALEARVAAAQAAIELARLSAPFAGTITAVQVMPGDQAALGSPAFRLDDLSRLLVDVFVSEVDINRIRLGQPVDLSFDAIQNQEYHGLVNQVAQVGLTVQGVTEFLVTVELTDADENVKPGMTAAVNIVVEELDNVLLVPNRAVRLVDGQRVVYILENNELVMVKIRLGASSDSESQVIDGELTQGELSPGDLIVLNPPQAFDSAGGPFGR
jgi:HlyD family secretion protein